MSTARTVFTLHLPDRIIIILPVAYLLRRSFTCLSRLDTSANAVLSRFWISCLLAFLAPNNSGVARTCLRVFRRRRSFSLLEKALLSLVRMDFRPLRRRQAPFIRPPLPLYNALPCFVAQVLSKPLSVLFTRILKHGKPSVHDWLHCFMSSFPTKACPFLKICLPFSSSKVSHFATKCENGLVSRLVTTVTKIAQN